MSIVAPAFEEEKALPLFHAELIRVVNELEAEFDVEVIYADDGSRDGTLELLRQMARDDARVGYLSLSRNFGHQAALTAGLEQARGDLIVTMDADLQHPPEVIPLLVQEWRKGGDIVVTVRADDPSLKWAKRLGSHLFYRVMRWMSGTEVRPSAADFRLMSRPAADALIGMRESHRFIRGMVQWLGFPCREVHFTPNQRVAGRSKYTFRKQLSLGLDGMFSFSKLPLRAVVAAGGVLILLGVMTALGLGTRRVFHPVQDWRFQVLLSAVLLVGGGVMAAVGVVGEYIGRIYEQVKGRPTYVLKESSPARQDQRVPLPDASRQSRAA